MYHFKGNSHGVLLFLVFASGNETKLKNLFFDANVTKNVAEKWSANYNKR